MIRRVYITDASAICDIYNHYIRNTVITFEETPVAVSVMERRLNEITKVFPWYVFERDGELLGYAHASTWKVRSAYRHTAEASVYIRHDALGRGIGTELYRKLLDELRSLGMHAVVGGIALPNERSQRLQERFGFTKVAHFTEVGFKFGRWIDVGYWELVFK